MKAPRLIIYSLLALVVAGGTYYYYFVYKAPRQLASPPKLEKVLPKNFLAAMNGQPAAGQTQVAAAKPGAPGGAPAAPASPATFTSDGAGHMTATVKNTGRRPIPFTLHAGEIYERFAELGHSALDFSAIMQMVRHSGSAA